MESGLKRRKAMENIEKSISEFVKSLTGLVNNIKSKDKKDRTFNEVYDKYNIVRKESPELIIQKAGQYLWKYREQITTGNVSFFINNNFEADIEEAKNESGIAEISGFDDTSYLLQKIKKIWQLFSETEKQVIIKNVKILLRQYAMYVSSCKELES